MKPGLAAVIVVVLVMGLVVPREVQAQPRPQARNDDELQAHLAALGQRLDDPTTDIGVRERLAMEMASTLDRATASVPSAETRRTRWTEAIEVLDRFNAKNEGHLQTRAFQVQAAVYLWARARTWLQAYRANPVDQKSRENAAADLDACVKRLRPVCEAMEDATDVLAQNARFRLAQALADLAEVGPDDPTARRSRNLEALIPLAKPITEPSLKGFAHLLRSLVLGRLGRYDEAAIEAASAAKSMPRPPESELIDASLAVMLGRKDFAGAIKTVDASKLNAGEKAALRVRVRLDERAARPEGPERSAAESALFAALNELRAASRPETRAALIAAARGISKPGPEQEPIAWDLLAEGALALGDPARAGVLEGRGADRAETLGRAAEAVTFRLRAGAYLFQAEKFAEADPLLSRIANDPKAGPERPRAGLLLALARGRALAMGRPGASQASYDAALRDQIKNFPGDPSASEARWLLGRLLNAGSDRPGALALWEAIPHGSPRWLESRVEIAGVRQRDLDAQRLNNDREAVSQRMVEARAFLGKALEEARGDVETNEIRLALARLELTPGLGRAEDVEAIWERLQRSAALASQRDAGRRLHLVALATMGHWVEAEQAARQEVRLSNAADLFPVVRMLDRSAAEAESDLRVRRVGHLLRILMARVLEDPEALPADLRAEARLRYVRALLFSGDDAAARRAVTSWTTPASGSAELLRDLAETYTRLEAYELAVDVQRLRSKLAPTGSPTWFDARYGLALAYYRAGKPRDALNLIDRTSILHPDLGGGDLREKFIRLRQRIEPSG